MRHRETLQDIIGIIVVEVEALSLAYLPGNSLRTRVHVVGEIAR